jgi:hypothetical protein
MNRISALPEKRAARISGKSKQGSLNMDSLQATEAASAAIAVAPRVTLESMEAKIESETYTMIDGILTLCTLKMVNGFYVTGESAPASPANFNAELGRKFARENAIRQLWKLEGYALREKLSAA